MTLDMIEGYFRVQFRLFDLLFIFHCLHISNNDIEGQIFQFHSQARLADQESLWHLAGTTDSRRLSLMSYDLNSE